MERNGNFKNEMWSVLLLPLLVLIIVLIIYYIPSGIWVGIITVVLMILIILNFVRINDLRLEIETIIERSDKLDRDKI